MKLPFNLVCIDLETTDTDSKFGSIIQLSAVVVNKSCELIKAREFDTYVQPLDSYRNHRAMRVNKISEEILKTAPTLHEVLLLFESFCDYDNILAAWGSYFDIPFLKKQYEKIYRKYPFSNRYVDLKSIAIWEMAKKDIPLSSGVRRFLKNLDKDFEGTPHNALDDIKNTVKILTHFKK